MINSLAAQQQCNTFVEIYFLRFPTIWQIRLIIAYIYYSYIYPKYIQGGPSKTSHQGAPRKPPYRGLPAQ